jgi:hypothetical protein
MNQRLSYSAAAPAVYKAMLALQASADEHCCVFARPELLGFTNFEKENTGVHTGRHCGAYDSGAWKSTRQASSQEFI